MNLVYISTIKNPSPPYEVFNLDSRKSCKHLAESLFDYYLETSTKNREDDPIYITVLHGEIEKADHKLRTQCGERFYDLFLEE